MSKYIIGYAPTTKEIRYTMVLAPNAVPFLNDLFTHIEADDESLFTYYQPGMPGSEYYYDEEKKMIFPKPKLKLTADKDSCPGNGSDVFTIKVELFDYEGNVLPWDEVKMKDMNEKAQISSETLMYGQDNSTFKVRAFSRCTARIRVKEANAIKNAEVDGASHYKLGRSYITLNFTNPGF